jgi:hypothetical protein
MHLSTTSYTYFVHDAWATNSPQSIFKPPQQQKLQRTTDAQQSFFSSKLQTFGLEQTNCEDKFWGIWGILDKLSAPMLIL